MGIEDVTLPLVLGTALVDSINPCAIGVLLFLVSVLLRASADRGYMLALGGIYVTTVYVVYMLSGIGLIWFQSFLISSGFAEVVGIGVGGLVIALGLIEIKDFFWHGWGVSLEIAPRFRAKLVEMSDRISFAGIVSIGAFVAMVELPCTGGPYLAITAILAKRFDSQAFLYLAIYNVVFVLPLVGILVLVYFGSSTLRLKQWRQEKRRWMNLASGLLMIGLGSLIVLFYAGGWHR